MCVCVCVFFMMMRLLWLPFNDRYRETKVYHCYGLKQGQITTNIENIDVLKLIRLVARSKITYTVLFLNHN